MNAIAVIALYSLMAIFDCAVLAGTVWLICERDWSAWWFLLAIMLMSGSSPRKIILASQGIDTERNKS